jgi:hypothetical protein
MPQYLAKVEEAQIRGLLDELADEWGLSCDKRESYFSGFYLDRLWYKILEETRIPFVAFEIEKGIPSNERIRKDIMNIAWSRAPVGYIILPHSRILNDPVVEQGSTWQNWYRNKFYKTFQEYRKPFVFYCDIQIIDADKLHTSRSLKTGTIVWEKAAS